MIKTEEKYTLRKSKKYKNLVSVGLGLAAAVAIGMATDNEAFASDVDKTDNPATNSVTKQPESTPEANNSQGKVNQSQGSVEVNLKSPELEKAVEKAVNGGVKVEKLQVVDKGTVKSTEELSKVTKEIKEEYKKQEQEIKEITEKYVVDKQKYQEELEKVTKENEKLKSDYNQKLSNYKKEKEELEKIKKANGTVINGKISILGDFNENAKGSLEYYKNFNVVVEENVDMLSEPIKWNKETKVTKISGSNDVIKNVKQSDGTYKDFYTNLKIGDKFKVSNVSKTHDGKNVHLVYTIKGFNSRENADTYYDKNSPFGTKHINFSQGRENSINVGIGVYDELKMSVEFLDDDGNSITTVSVNVLTDVDWKQGLSVKWNKSETIYKIPNDSMIEKIGDSYHEKSGLSFDDVNSVPQGSLMFAGYGSSVDLTYYGNHPGERGVFGESKTDAGYFFTMFGNTFKGKTYFNQPPKEPVYKEVPKVPEVPTVKYNTYKVNVVPSIEKQVKNTENQDINNQYVSKLSTVKWELRTKVLPAGRKEIDKYLIKDSLPKGYILDVEKTKEESKDYDLSYNKDTHTVTLSATAKLLEQLNKDLTKSILAPIPTLVGTVTNDGATYKNNFSLTINNDYEVYSNIVKVSTPGKPNDEDNPNNNLIKPEKHNYNKDGVLIDGKQVERGSVNYYKLLWDLDQYKGIKATKEDIKKGFYYVDDYPEEALELLEKDVKIVDSNNDEVKGITVKSYESLDKSPKEVQEMLKKAGITPKGAYQLFTVDNPEEFFEKYVVKGNSIHITSPMKVKEDFNSNGGKYENKAYQIDFGNGYESEVVVNNVPKKEQPPKPSQPKEKEKPKEKILPKTSAVKENSQGYNNILGYILMTLLTFVLGLFGIKRKVK